MSENKLKKFKKGCILLGLDFEDITKNYKYCGGSQNEHSSYWKLLYRDKLKPLHKSECICQTKIERNCYIRKGEDILVLGSCCIKAFCEYYGRTCEICDAKHKRSKSNRCKDCKDFKKCNMIDCMKPKFGYSLYCTDHDKLICREKNCNENKKGKSMYCTNHFYRKCNNSCCKKMTEGYLNCYDCNMNIT
jgi:hypothetical protein